MLILGKMRNSFIVFLFCSVLVACSSSHRGYIGEEYVGKKYTNDPLGEEKYPDMDPLIRYDAFDCLTFVETSLAGGDLDKLNKIRYKNGEIDFITRNHFIETDWVPNNKDIVENISNKYGKTAFRDVVIDKQKWFKKIYKIDAKIPKQTVKIEYIPYSDLNDIKNTEPLIVLFVVNNPKMRDRIGTDLAVYHLGFLLPNGILRHASRDMGRVVDVKFKEYVAKRAKNKNDIGITLLGIK